MCCTREKNSPLSIFQDKYSEFLSFPTIYCGQTRPDNNSRLVPLHYSTIYASGSYAMLIAEVQHVFQIFFFQNEEASD